MKHRQLGKAGLMVQYFSTFLLTTVPAQLFLFLVFLLKSRAPRKVYVYLAILAGYVVIVLVSNPVTIPMKNMLFYFSFVAPFLVMLSLNHSLNLVVITDGFIAALCLITLALAILVNSPLGGDLWFMPAEHGHRGLFGGFYQRPLGMAGVASSSAALIVFSLVLNDQTRTEWTLFNKRNVLGMFAVTVIASGTGFMLFVLYLMIRLLANAFSSRRMKFSTKLMITAVVLMLILGASGTFVIEGFNKFSFAYALLILADKQLALRETTPENLSEVLLGGQVSPVDPTFATASDFGYLSMFNAIGILGSMLVLLPPFLFARSLGAFAVPTIFFFLSFVHYPALSSPPGAVLFATFLYMLRCYEKAELRIADRQQRAQERYGLQPQPAT